MTFRRDRVYLYLDWVKQKLLLDARSTTAKKRIVIRGQVYKCHLDKFISLEQIIKDKDKYIKILKNKLSEIDSNNN